MIVDNNKRCLHVRQVLFVYIEEREINWSMFVNAYGARQPDVCIPIALTLVQWLMTCCFVPSFVLSTDCCSSNKRANIDIAVRFFAPLMTISLTLNIDWLGSHSFPPFCSARCFVTHGTSKIRGLKVDLCWYHCAVWFLMNWLTRARVCVHVCDRVTSVVLWLCLWVVHPGTHTFVVLPFFSSLLVMARMRNNWMKHVSWLVSNTSYQLRDRCQRCCAFFIII